MSAPKSRPGDHWTYRDYRAWPEGERWELIGGVAHGMTPAPGRRHQQLVGELFRQVANFLQGHPRCAAFVAPLDVRLPRAGEADDTVDTVVQPDLMVYCDPSRLDERGARGAPDWVVEVLSPATSQKDLTLKRDLYERHGVIEYWALHPQDRVVTLWLREPGGERFAAPRILPAAGRLASRVLEGLEVDLDLAYGPLGDPPPG